MAYQNRPVIWGENLGGKILQLLLLLIYFREEGIRREQLLAELYGDIDAEQASNSLRAILYRLRRGLKAAGLPDDGGYVATKGGVYRWQADCIEIEVDAEEFQKNAIAALAETKMEEKARLLEETCRMYRGAFLPMMITDKWVSAANWKYQELYFKCLRELTGVLKAQKSYHKLLGLCEQALDKYPYEEWQMVKLDCLAAMKEYKYALLYYERVAADYQREFGMLPSEALVQRYRSIKNMVQYEMGSIEDIQNHLHPNMDTVGATRCDYLTFMDIFRYIVWLLERKGINAYLILFTLVDQEGLPLESSGHLEEARLALEKAIGGSVRKSDLYTRYGKNQFLMLLIDLEQPGCEIACGRILEKFRSMNQCKNAGIYYTYRPALEIAGDTLQKNVDQGLKDWRA